jgi:signal transduction histidine kinase
LNQFVSFLFFIFLFSCSKKDRTVDYNATDIEHINELLELSQNENIKKKEKLVYADSVFLKLMNQQNDSLIRNKYFSLANSYFTLYDLENYYKISKKVLALSTSAKDTISIGKAQFYIGDYYFEKTQNDSAFIFYKKAEDLFLRINDKKNLAKVILYKAYILLYEKDFLGSEIATIKALNLSEDDEDDEVFKYECYVNLGSSSLGLENFNKALEYHKKSLTQNENLKSNPFYDVLKAQSYNNIGLVYLKQKKFKDAEANFKKGLEVSDIEKKHSLIYASLLDNLAYSKFKLKDKSAVKDFLRALEVRDSLDNVSGIIKSKIHLAEYYLKNRNFKNAIQLNKEAYIIAKNAKFYEDVLRSLQLFDKIDPQNGLEYSKEYIKLSDSLHKVERETRNKLARIEFETDEIILEKEVLSEQKKKIIIISIILTSFIFLLYIILYLRGKQKKLLFAQEQQRANEEIYQLMINQQEKVDEGRNIEKNRIAKDLHDGIMNRLTSTRLNLFVLSKRRDDETIEKCIEYINDIQNIEKEVRSIAHELNNDAFLQKNSFKSILKELLTEQNKLFSANCEYSIDKKIKWDLINVAVKMNLYRIIQEALNNCNKYANAETITISILRNEANNTILLNIEDNGVGFNTEKGRKGIGFKNMKERAEAISGSLKFHSKINVGTTITIEFPLVS